MITTIRLFRYPRLRKAANDCELSGESPEADPAPVSDCPQTTTKAGRITKWASPFQRLVRPPAPSSGCRSL